MPNFSVSSERQYMGITEILVSVWGKVFPYVGSKVISNDEVLDSSEATSSPVVSFWVRVMSSGV